MKNILTLLVAGMMTWCMAAPVRSNISAKCIGNQESSPTMVEVEYIEAKQTGPFLVLPSVPQKCAFDFFLRIYCIGTGAAEFMGCKTSGTTSCLQLVLTLSGIIDYPRPTGYRRVTTSGVYLRQWRDVEVSGNLLKVDGEVQKSDFNNSFDLGWEPTGIGLFGTCNSSGSYYSRTIARVAYLRYSADGELVFDGVAVRFVNENNEWEGGMYDQVSGQIFRNAGTGAFLIGPDKN